MICIAFSAIVLAALLRNVAPSSQCEESANDLTLQEGATGKAVVEATIRKISSSALNFREDYGFLRNMAAAETNDGATAGTGNGGIWGISQDTFDDVSEIMKNSPLKKNFSDAFCFDWTTNVSNRASLDIPLYSALSVLIIMEEKKPDLSDSLQTQADAWIDIFNSGGDKNTFISAAESLLQTGNNKTTNLQQ